MRNHQGFTLIELMVTITVAAIIMAMAVPSMQTMRANSRVFSAANTLAADLKKARNEAIMSRRNHTLSAIDVSVSSNKWGNKGWQLIQVVNSVNQIVFENKTLAQGVTINEPKTSVVFTASTGILQTTTALPTDMSFNVCDGQSSKETGYSVLINRFGRVLIQRHTSSETCNA